jgi:hypothetical protein
MKLDPGTVAVVLIVVATVLLLTMSARAGQRGDDPTHVEVQAPASSDAADAVGETLLDISGTITLDEPVVAAPVAADDQARLDGLLAIAPPGGWQLPPPAEVDMADWQEVRAGAASMRLPPGWTVQNQIGDEGTGDVTIGLSPEALDLYIELRQIRNSDSNYMTTLAEHAHGEYARSVERLEEGVIFGYQPLVIDGALGGVEVMNQFGKERDEDGSLTFRLILWRGRWEQDDQIHRVEFTATFAQDRHDEFAPLVHRVLSTVRIDRTPVAATAE